MEAGVDWWNKCDCIIQLKLCGVPLRSILENMASLCRVSRKGWPVLESIKLRRVCETYTEHIFKLVHTRTKNKFQGKKNSLTCTTSWLHHKIAWCSIESHTFFMPVLLIIKPWVGGTMPSSDSIFERTLRKA